MPLNNIDVFAWNHSDMIGINPTVGLSQTKYYAHGQTNKTESEAFPPRSPSDHSDGSRQLAKYRFHQKSKIPRMASQRRGGSKKGGKWRVCVDYTDLNEACPKDSFSLLV